MNKSVTNIKNLTTSQDFDVVKIKTERNSLGVLNTIIVLLLIAVQLALLVLSSIYFSSVFQILAILSIILTLITCLYVLSTDKNSQSKPVWILFLLTCFTFGYIIYFISNEKVFWGRYKKRYERILINSYNYQKASNIETNNKITKKECVYLEKAGNFAAYKDTDAKYFSSGTLMFDSVIEDLKNAKKFIFIEFFIFSDGVLLKRILNILSEKVKQGVDVRIIYDDLGSHGSLKYKTKKAIKNTGIKIHSFNKLLPKFSAMLNYRDHRKIIVIDGKVAYTGGTNLADEYINEKRMYGYWKDAGIRVDGAAVEAFTLMFLRQWEFVTKQSINYANYLGLAEKRKNTSVFVPYADGLEYADNIGKNVYTNMIANANEKIYIMSPYFVIDDTINNLLINKAKSGVDVRIVLPEIADKKIVYIISRNNAEKLIKHGVKIYTMKNSFVHSKVMFTENSAVVGSINMDLRSFYQQFESAIYTNDDGVMRSIEEDFNETFEKSLRLNNTNLKRNKLSFKIIAGITNIISPFM